MSPVRQYLQHARRHGPHGSDPILELTNDWMTSAASLLGVASGVATNIPYDSIGFQTDDGSVYAPLAGVVDSIEIKQVGTYLVRAAYVVPSGLSGTILIGANINGPGATVVYPYNDTPEVPLDIPGNPLLIWEQLVVVGDLSAPTSVYNTVTQSTGSPQDIGAYLQIFRLT